MGRAVGAGTCMRCGAVVNAFGQWVRVARVTDREPFVDDYRGGTGDFDVTGED